MDRLTMRDTAENGRKCIWLAGRVCVYADRKSDKEAYTMAERIALLEDLAKQGRLVELPCAVGAEAWYVLEMFGEICKATISKIELNSFTNPQIWFTVVYHSRCIGMQEIKVRADFMLGKTVFLTREEAEAKLAELEVTDDE